MENKHIIILLLVVIVVLAAAIGWTLFSPAAKEPTKIKITSDRSQYEEDASIEIKLTDSNKTALSKEIVNITITNKKGKVVVDDVVKTDSKGKAKLDLDLKKGKYVVNVTYGGNENYTGNSTTQKIKIEEKVVEADTTSSSSSSSSDDYVYSPQSQSYVKKSGQMSSDGSGNSIYQYQGDDGVIYERYYDSSGKEIDPNEYYE